MEGGEVWDTMCVSDKDELQTERSLSAIAALVKVYKHTHTHRQKQLLHGYTSHLKKTGLSIITSIIKVLV